MRTSWPCSSTLGSTFRRSRASLLIRGDVFYWGPLMAGALLASVPVVVAYAFLMDYYVSGLVAGATKY